MLIKQEYGRIDNILMSINSLILLLKFLLSQKQVLGSLYQWNRCKWFQIMNLLHMINAGYDNLQN